MLRGMSSTKSPVITDSPLPLCTVQTPSSGTWAIFSITGLNGDPDHGMQAHLNRSHIMAERLVTIKEIVERSGIYEYIIRKHIAQGLFPAPHVKPRACHYPMKFRVSEVNKWIIDYGNKLINLQEISKLLNISYNAVNWLSWHRHFPTKYTVSADGPLWLRISIIRWRKNNPGYKDYIKRYMRKKE